MAAALQEAMDDTLRRLRPRPTSEAQAATGKTFSMSRLPAGDARRVRPPGL